MTVTKIQPKTLFQRALEGHILYTHVVVAETQSLIFNARLDAVICGIFLVLVTTILVDSIRVWSAILRGAREVEVREAPFVLSRLNPEEI